MYRTGSDLINDARTRIRVVAPAEVQAALAKGEPTVLLDVREPNEVALGRIAGALHIPRGYLEQRVEAQVPREAALVVYCASGERSALAADTLMQMGYANVASLAGGFRDWATSGGAIEG